MSDLDCCLLRTVYLMTVDNSGPQSVSEVMEGWRNLRLLFPNATILDSSLEAFTAEAWKVKDRMPVVTQELGDTWIRGTAADPTKQRRYREVARHLAAGIQGGSLKITQPEVQRAYDQLIKLPEHTYGSNDGKVAGAHTETVASTVRPHCCQCRIHTYALATGLPWDNTYMDQHINDTNYRVTNSGWSDQRAYISRAVTALGSLPIRAEIEQALAASEPSAAAADTAGLSVWKLGADGAPQGTLQCNSNDGVVRIGFDASGAISSLQADSPASGSIGRQWADANHTLGRFRYLSHSEVGRYVPNSLGACCADSAYWHHFVLLL